MMKYLLLALLFSVDPLMAKDFYGPKGNRPPQFVLLSFDGGGDLKMWKDILKTSRDFERKNPRKKLDFTHFFSGAYVVPYGSKAQRNYLTPGWSSSRRGRLNLGKNGWGQPNKSNGRNPSVEARIKYLAEAHNSGHLIGSHAVSHADGHNWSRDYWMKEMDAFFKMLKAAPRLVNMKSPTVKVRGRTVSWSDFVEDHVRGFRAPLLGNGEEGTPKSSRNLFRTLEYFNMKTDSSDVRVVGDWPRQLHGTDIWNIGLGWIPKKITRRSNGVIAMDYNMIRGKYSPKATARIYREYFDSVYYGSRSPVVIGHHFGAMGGGRNSRTGLPKYWHVLKDFALSVCAKKEVRCVTYEEYRRWLLRTAAYKKIKKGRWVNNYTVKFPRLKKRKKDGRELVKFSQEEIEASAKELSNKLNSGEVSLDHNCALGDRI